MNFGECPYDGCDGILNVAVPDVTPAYTYFNCETCGRLVWYMCSRMEPMAWTEDDFLRTHNIDVENRTITRKPGVPR